MNSKIDESYLIITRANKIFNLESKENDNDMLIEQLKQIFITKKSGSSTDFPNRDNFEALLCGLLILVKLNSGQINFQYLEEQKKIQIVMNKTIEFTDFQLFSKLFEELTLHRLQFVNTENEWKAELAL